MKKYIICDIARSDWGKSQTLLEVIEQFKTQYTPTVEEQIGSVDKYTEFDLNNNKLVVNTQGDPDSYQREGLKRAIKVNAKIILCASRTKGSTIECVYEMASNGYEVIWLSNLFADNEMLPCIPMLRKLTAEMIVNLALNLIKNS